MLRLGLVALGLVATSVAGYGQTAPASPTTTAPAAPSPANAFAPAQPTTLPDRHVKRPGSPGFHAGVPIIEGNGHIRVDSVGQVLTDELP